MNMKRFAIFLLAALLPLAAAADGLTGYWLPLSGGTLTGPLSIEGTNGAGYDADTSAAFRLNIKNIYTDPTLDPPGSYGVQTNSTVRLQLTGNSADYYSGVGGDIWVEDNFNHTGGMDGTWGGASLYGNGTLSSANGVNGVVRLGSLSLGTITDGSGGKFLATNDGAGTFTTGRGVYGAFTNYGGTVTTGIGAVGVSAIAGGVVTQSAGVYSAVSKSGGTLTTGIGLWGAGTFADTTAYGANIENTNSGGVAYGVAVSTVAASAGNAYGLFMQAVSATGGTAFGVYQNDTDLNSFGGPVGLRGTSSGEVSIKAQAAAGTYNFNLPTTAGSSGDFLLSGGGGVAAMTYLTPGSGVSTFLATPSGANLASALTSALPATDGGTGLTGYAVGDLLYADTTTTLTVLANPAANNRWLRSVSGAAPTWSAISIPNSGVASGGVVYATSTTALGYSGTLTANKLVKGGGAGAAPADSQITDDGTTITLPGTTVNITATTLQRSGNTVGMVRTFTATINPASLAAATTRTDTYTVTGLLTTGGAVSCNQGVDPVTTEGQCVPVNMRASATNTLSVTWRNTLDAVTACDVPSSTWTCSQAQ